MIERWSTIKKLIWLQAIRGGGQSGVDTTVRGTAPIALENALSAAIMSLIQYGKCEQDGTPTPSAPVDIVCNNGAVRMLNLAYTAESNLDIGYYINNSGVRTFSAPNFYTLGYVAVKPETTYTMKTSAPLNYFSIMEYDSAQGFLNRTLWGTTGSPAGDTITFTTRSDTVYLRFGSNMNGNTLTYADIAAVTWMLSEGATAKNYVPFGTLYTDGTPEVLTVTDEDSNAQTASVADLFSVGEVADEQDIISGAVTHKVGIKVFDGTEAWIDGNNGYITEAVQDQSGGTYAPVCSHFRGVTTAPAQNSNTVRCYRTSGGTGRIYFAPNATTYPTKEDFAAWLATQYAAGTPVIVIYPLAEEVSESVASQELRTSDGTNVVSVEANVSDITLEAKYKAKGA